MNQKDIFLRKWTGQQIAQSELDRKWRLQLEAQEQELMMAEQAVYLATLNPMNALHIGGGGLSGVTGRIEAIINSTESLTTSWCVTSSAPTTFTVDWGDGNIDEYNAEGNECFQHTYATGDIWNVVITFADPELITELEFND